MEFFMIKINKLSKLIALISLTFGVLLCALIINKEGIADIIETSSLLSNEKIGWGIKRNNNHTQPDLGAKNKLLIERYNGIAMGNNEENIIYLTFDSGYEAGYTQKILDVLKEKNVKATFFITAHYLNTAPEFVKRMIDEGHIVGNHVPKCLMSGVEKI